MDVTNPQPEVSPDVTNDCLVGVRGERIVLLTLGAEMSKGQALRMAAWIVAIADPLDEQFPALLAAVHNT